MEVAEAVEVDSLSVIVKEGQGVLGARSFPQRCHWERRDTCVPLLPIITSNVGCFQTRGSVKLVVRCSGSTLLRVSWLE